MEHLTALGLTPETLLDQLRQAWHVRARNQALAARHARPVDPDTDLGLMNHILLLDSLAQLAGIEQGPRRAAMSAGRATGNAL